MFCKSDADHGQNAEGGCGCGWCAICFKECGEDAHDHVEEAHHDFEHLHNGFFINEVHIQEHWKRMKIESVLAYLHDIEDKAERDRAYDACVHDFAMNKMDIKL